MLRRSVVHIAMFLAMGLATPVLADDTKPLSGQSISVLLPPWGTLPKELVGKFETDTGVTVDIQSLGWDDLRTKIVTSLVAGTAPADVIEFDWSWVGQFGAAGWFEPLDGLIDQAIIEDNVPAKIFRYNDRLLGLPYSNDFRILIINSDHFRKAGITAMPATLDELIAAAKAIKDKGIAEYPLGLALSPNEGTSIGWYMLTKAFGGELFSPTFEPLFTKPDSPGYKALAWQIEAFKAGLIDPASTGLTDLQVQERFKNGEISIDLVGWAGNLAVYNDASKSKIAGSAQGLKVPSAGGASRTFGLPEAVGIPSMAKNKEAAAAFISFMMQPESQVTIYQALGNLPTRLSVLKALDEQGKLAGGRSLIDALPSVEPLFKQGTPPWYPKFSGAVGTAINQAAKGQISVDAAIARMAEEAAEAMQE